MAKIPGQKVISGSMGKLWLNSKLIAEVKSIESKATINRETVLQGGSYDEDSKITSVSCAGSFVIHKVFTREAEFINALKKGVDTRFTLFVTLDDPQAYGKETVKLDNCWFTELTVAQFEVGSILEREFPFGHTLSGIDNAEGISVR